MSNSPDAIQSIEQGTYEAGAGLVVAKLPDEVGVPLRRDDFQTLCEGGIYESRASRDLCIGIFVGVLVGIIGIFAIADWESIWKPEHRNSFLFWVGFLLVLAAGSAVGAIIFWVRCYRTATNSPYSRLVGRLCKVYEAQTTGSTAVDTATSPQKLSILSAQYGVEGKYTDVTTVLAALIRDMQLEVEVGNNLSPDPCPGIRKHLVVRYQCNGQIQTKSAKETETLKIP